MSVAVLIAWRPGCPHRQRNFDWLQGQYATHHPDWPLIIGEHGPGPWVKAHAIPFDRTDADTLIVADADVWSDHLATAVDALDTHPWAIPHRRVRRLTEHATSRVLAGEPPARMALDEPAYTGTPGGGIVILPRSLAQTVPLDPRFVGWGAEDKSWGYALRILAGAPWRGHGPLWHLWHPPQDRPDRVHGHAENEALRARYEAVRRDPTAMRALLDEVRHGTDSCDAHQRPA